MNCKRFKEIYLEHKQARLESKANDIKENIEQKFVIRDGKKVRKDVSDKDGYKIRYEEGKPKEVKVSEKETQNRENGQVTGQAIRDQKMNSMQSKRIESLKKT
jgi:hypothetical protein